MSVELQLVPGSLGSGYCPATYQELYNRMFDVGYAVLPDGLSTFVKQHAEPSVDQRDLPWIRLTASGAFDKVYIFIDGQWCSPHAVPASSNQRIVWVGEAADVDIFDGGAAGTVGNASGPMWEIDTAFAARFPVGVGTFAASGAVAVNDTGGEDRHVLTEAEMPANLEVTVASNDHTSDVGTTLQHKLLSDTVGSAEVDVSVSMSAVGAGTAHNNLPPYIGVYFLKRTARLYYIPS